MAIYDIVSKTWTYYPVSGSTSWQANIWAADLAKRRIFISDASIQAIFKWDMDLHTFTRIATSPCAALPATTVQSDKGYLVWDSNNRVLIQNCYQGAATFAYHPDDATPWWEDLSNLPMQGADGKPPVWNTTPYSGGGVGVVQFNSVTFDSVNNWLVGLGWQGVWVFRYGATAAPSPPPPPPQPPLPPASTNPAPDMVSVAATTTNDGVVDIPGTTGTNAFATATVNSGAPGTVTATVDDNGQNLALRTTLCQTDPKKGTCINPRTPGKSAVVKLRTNGVATFTVFVTATGTVPFDPVNNRLTLRLKTADGVTRGATGVAVRTAEPPQTDGENHTP